MLVQLADLLRCPADHAESALVLAVDTWSGGQVAAGSLGCPACRATFRIREDTVLFTGEALPPPSPPFAGDPTEAAWRLAAQLDLLSPGRPVLLAGRYAALAAELTGIAGVACLCLDARAPRGAVSLVAGDRLPLAAGSLRGAAVGPERASPRLLAELARVTMDGGRVVGPAGIAAPPGVSILAEDDAEWVGRSEGPGPLLQLRRGTR